MWTREIIKQEAKNSLKKFGYWMPLLVSLVVGIIEGVFSGGAGGANSSGTEDAMLDEIFADPVLGATLITIYIIVFVVVFVLALSWGIFVVGPVIVGKNRYFMEHRAFGSKFERIFYVFHKGRYMNTVKTLFWYDIKIFLWSLLFIIPGIIKSYEYYMVPYILAENPNIDTKRAFEISKMMTKGEKFDIFILEISFIGWQLLGMLCCCVGIVFVRPYYEATFAELYQVMREKAHGLGFADYNDLPGFFPDER